MNVPSFVSAMKDFFGNLPGKTAKDFLMEIKNLDHDDRLYFHRELAKVGINCAEPAIPQATMAQAA